MKKLFLILVLLGVLGGVGFAGYKFLYPSTNELPAETVEEIEIEEDPIIEIEEEIEEDFVIEEEDIIIEDTAPTTNKRRVPALSEKKLFSNSFVQFVYPGNLTVESKTMSSLEIFLDTERIGLIAIYTNEESLDLETFLKKDNLMDYFTEGAKFNIYPENIDLPTAIRAVRFKDFPGFVVSDIAVIEFEQLVLVITDWSENDIILEYIVPSMERFN